MIDVHPPHKSIGNAGEFFLHLFTITIGLLIAVGIEGAVERHEHHKLADDARQTMTAEIRRNAKQADAELAAIGEAQKKNADELGSVLTVQLDLKNNAKTNLNIFINYSFIGLEDTAWKTAQETGALSYMSYAEAERYSDIYAAEQDLMRGEDQVAEDQTQLVAVTQQVHPGKGTMTQEGVDSIARQLGVIEGHLITLKLSARVLQAEQKAFLEGKDAPQSVTGVN